MKVDEAIRTLQNGSQAMTTYGRHEERLEALATLRAYHAQVQAVAGEMRTYGDLQVAIRIEGDTSRLVTVREWADRLYFPMERGQE